MLKAGSALLCLALLLPTAASAGCTNADLKGKWFLLMDRIWFTKPADSSEFYDADAKACFLTFDTKGTGKGSCFFKGLTTPTKTTHSVSLYVTKDCHVGLNDNANDAVIHAVLNTDKNGVVGVSWRKSDGKNAYFHSFSMTKY